MAESADDPTLHWIEPRERGVIPLEGFHVPRRLARTVRADRFTVVADRDFEGVIEACAGQRAGSERTWINGRIRQLYGELFELGHCHSIEVYREDRLVGGLYGLALGAAFFGESMFHRETDASKVALVHLVARLLAGGFRLLDAQFQTEHLAQFGTEEIPRRRYRDLLDEAIMQPADFAVWPADQPVPGARALTAIAAG